MFPSGGLPTGGPGRREGFRHAPACGRDSGRGAGISHGRGRGRRCGGGPGVGGEGDKRCPSRETRGAKQPRAVAGRVRAWGESGERERTRTGGCRCGGRKPGRGGCRSRWNSFSRRYKRGVAEFGGDMAAGQGVDGPVVEELAALAGRGVGDPEGLDATENPAEGGHRKCPGVCPISTTISTPHFSIAFFHACVRKSSR